MAIITLITSLTLEAFILNGFPLLVMAGTVGGIIAMLIAAMSENHMGG